MAEHAQTASTDALHRRDLGSLIQAQLAKEAPARERAEGRNPHLPLPDIELDVAEAAAQEQRTAQVVKSLTASERILAGALHFNSMFSLHVANKRRPKKSKRHNSPGDSVESDVRFAVRSESWWGR